MIITRTPFRISFFGGGTDYPAWYRERGGAVLSTTIDKYCYISCRFLPPFFSHRHCVVWSRIELVNAIAEMSHPVVREGLRFLEFDDSAGVEIHHQGDLPARSGIGSSSSFSVGFIKALSALRGHDLSKHELALKAIQLEQCVLKESVGSQDQIAAAFGGFNIIRLATNGEIRVDPLPISASRRAALESHLMLFYTGKSRLSSEIASRIISGLGEHTSVLQSIHAMVDRGADILGGTGDLDELGALLDEAWMLKKKLDPVVTCPEFDSVYSTARKCGALGGKILGAGGGGFVLFYVPPASQARVIEELRSCLHVPFGFEDGGCQFIMSQDAVQLLTDGVRSL